MFGKSYFYFLATVKCPDAPPNSQSEVDRDTDLRYLLSLSLYPLLLSSPLLDRLPDRTDSRSPG